LQEREVMGREEVERLVRERTKPVAAAAPEAVPAQNQPTTA
jgi:hypothetical protein